MSGCGSDSGSSSSMDARAAVERRIRRMTRDAKRIVIVVSVYELEFEISRATRLTRCLARPSFKSSSRALITDGAAYHGPFRHFHLLSHGKPIVTIPPALN